MLQPFILIGVGGSGGKTVRAVRQNLQWKLEQLGWSHLPKGWQFLHIDAPTSPDGIDFPAPLLPQDDYLSVVPRGLSYRQVHDRAINGLGKEVAREAMRPLPAPPDVTVPIELGAGALRGIGRTLLVAGLKDVSDRVRGMLSEATGQGADAELAQLTRELGFKVGIPSSTPTIIVISSVAGGSGAGMFIDVSEAIKAAVGPKDAAHRIFSLLYAPDVFEELGPKAMAAMVPNSMGALSELVAGFWRGMPTQTTMSVYKQKGLTVPTDDKSTIGPGFNYVLGRRNGGANAIDFGSQQGVYLAVASSVTAWMTDARVQDNLTAYAVANFQTLSANLTDNSLLKPSGKGQPLSSLGFARVSLGTEKFFEYAAERIAKQAVTTMLTQHLSTDPERREKKEDQWIEHHANLNEGTFIADSGLNERTELNNQVTEALQPDLEPHYAKLRRVIEEAATAGMPAGGQSFDQWTTKIVNAYQLNLSDVRDEVERLRNEKIRSWVITQPTEVLALVTKTMSQLGLPVTVKLLERLIQQCKEAIGDLKEERGRHLRDADALTQNVSQALGAASGMSTIPRTNPAVAQALHQAQMCFYWSTMADLKESTGELLEDFVGGYLAPLTKRLAEGLEVLRSSATDPNLPDGNVNPYLVWPTFDQTTVDRRFDPAPNEQMLISPDAFASEFDRLVLDSVSDPHLPAHRIVIDEVLLGANLPDVAKLKHEDQWKILSVPDGRGWIPKNRHFQPSTASNQVAQFAFETDPLKYLSVSKKWIRLPGRAFRAFIEQTVVSYLKTSDQAERARRGKRFTAAMAAAAQSSYPLVALDRALLDATHGPIEVSAVCSGIPLDREDPLYEPIANSLLTNGYDPEKAAKDWFVGEGKGSMIKSIEIFAQLSVSMGPIPLASMLSPILNEWNRVSKNTAARMGFMSMRRARLLPEAIPAHPTHWRAMLAGWFVARLLNQVQEDKSGKDFKDAGPQLSVWADDARGFVDFPFPLYSAHIASSIHHYPGVILDSLMIALAQCHGAHNLSPLAPYQRLLELGGGGGHWIDLQEWVLTGKPRHGAPTPKSERAGSSELDVEGRRAACVAYLESCQSTFDKFISALNPNADPRTYPVSWEIREDVEWAINQAIDACNHVDDGEEL